MSPTPDEMTRAMENARTGVITAALNLAATEWGNGRETAGDSFDLDHAQDRMDEALKTYVRTATKTADPTSPASNPSEKGST
ncbi:hypothetical protein [Actinomadura sp. GTD37]|uniref:hypothetical protein n=1 Tax=Actinomadura sp. GTD37 TaxID=1778030 RepID=UPI0035C14CC0